MATSSDGGHVDSSADMSGYAPYSPPSGDMRFHLQSLLDSKEKQLQQAGTLGQQLLTQRVELEERIRQLQELDLDGGDGEDVRGRYRELADTVKAWDAENEQLSSVFGLKPSNGVSTSPPAELSRGELERTMERTKGTATGTTAAQSSRRAKNAAHRADDVEFAFEIGSGLLTEVRRLQSLLAERDKAIQDMKEERDDLEKTVESLRTALRQQEQSADKFKEENWNLEVTLQELRASLVESQATTQRLEGEQKRLTKLLTTSREAVDQHKNEAERHQNAFQELKAKHDTDVAQYRRTQAGLQRDKLDLQSSLESAKEELAKVQKKVPRFGSPLTPNGGGLSVVATPAHEDDDMLSMLSASTNRKRMDNSALFPPDGFDFPDESPENSPSRPFLAPNHPSNEIEALQQRLAHAQRQINTLKGSLQREKEMRIDYKRKLDSSMVADGDEEEEEAEEEDEMFPPIEESTKSKPRLTPFRAGKTKPRAKGRGGLTLMQRLAAQSPAAEEDLEDDDDQFFRESSPPPRKSLGDDDFIADDSGEEEPDVQQSPSSRISSKRTSVEGMDPAFANVLRRSSSGRSFTHGISPLRHSAFGRSARGRGRPLSRKNRGGAAFQQARPPSFAGEPEALANELGQLGFGNLEDTFEVPEDVTDTAEIACQTDDIEEAPVPSVVVTSPSLPVAAQPSVAEFGVQVDPEPIPVPVRSETSSQTLEVVVPVRVDSEVQHEDLSPRPIMLSAGVTTDADVPRLVQAAVVQTDIPEPLPAVQETPKPRLVEMDIQTVPEVIIVRQDADIQTLASVTAVSSDAGTQTRVVPVSETEVQADEVFVASAVPKRVYSDMSVGDSSGDTTITLRPIRSAVPVHDSEEDDDTATETGSVMETDTEDYVDARQSISLITPTESLEEDYHSIMTVTDNDFSESDDESIKASRISSRQGLVASTSSSQPSLPSPPAPPILTYESVGVSADLIEEREPIVPSVSEPLPAPVPEPTPELKEISIQTDEWTPPAPQIVSAAPPSPTLLPSPTLIRVGTASQQFQFISPPPSAGPTTTALPIVSASPNATIRDSASSFIPRPRTSHSDRRRSIESTLSSAREDALVRSRTPSNVASVVDKSRPPMMVLPPPPRQPPPPNAMPPPTFIPEKRQPTASNASQDVPPPRPSSPPPPELIQRATTPTFGSVLSVPGVRPFGLRHHTSSMASSQGMQGMRQPPSTGSFRSTATSARPGVISPSAQSFTMRDRERRERSTTSLTSGGHSVESQRSSVSSEHLAYDQPSNKAAPTTPERQPGLASRQPAGGATDPTVIHAITQTMIGEFLYKYTRKTIGKGHGERRHKRFFWVHPYTRTLYWSSADPGSSNVSESSAKSAYVEAVRSVLDPNPMPPGIYQYSVVVSTPQREMKFTAPTKERHDIWLNALQYLLTRPNGTGIQSPNAQPNGLTSPVSMEAELAEADGPRPGIFSSPQSQRSVRTTRTVDSWGSTPRGQRSHSQLSVRGGSMGKRSGTPAAEYLRWGGPDPYSPTKSFEHVPGGDDEELDFELHDETLSDDGFEGLENVRACCDGRHTVGRSGKIEHHHHHHHHPSQSQLQPQQPPSAPLRSRENHLDPNPHEITRPLSPAWSFRSRSGSTASNDGAGFFSRFGSRRSAKTSTTER